MSSSTVNSITSTLCTIMMFLLLVCFQFNSAFSKIMEGDDKDLLLRELSGGHLLMSASPDPPWFNEKLDENGTVTYYGLNIEVCNYLAEALNITYSFVRIREDEERKSGRKEASFNLLKRGEVNMTTKFILLNGIECTRADCSLPWFTSKSQLMVPWPKEESRILATIRPFQLEVWLLLPISMICVTFTIIYLPKYYKESKNTRGEIWTAAFYVLTTGGGWDQWKYKLSFRIIQGTWCLAAFVLFNAYSSTVISYLTAPKLMPVAKTLKEVAIGQPQSVKILVEKDSPLASLSLRATNGTYKMLGDSLRQNPDSFFIGQPEGFEKLYTGRYAYASVDTQVMVYMDMAYRKSGNRCKFTVSNPEISKNNKMVWTFPKNWRYTDAVNYRLKWLSESGLVDYWQKRILPKLDQCQLDNYQAASEEKRVLNLSDLMGPFLLFLAGIAVSFTVFLMEIILFKYQRARLNIISPPSSRINI